MSPRVGEGFPPVRLEVEDVAIQAPSADQGVLLIRPVVLPAPSRADVAHRLAIGIRAVTRRLPAVLRDSRGPNADRGVAVARLLRGAFEDLGGTFSKFG